MGTAVRCCQVLMIHGFPCGRSETREGSSGTAPAWAWSSQECGERRQTPPVCPREGGGGTDEGEIQSLQQWVELVAENPCFRNPAVRPRVQVQHDFDIKGVVGIKNTSLPSPRWTPPQRRPIPGEIQTTGPAGGNQAVTGRTAGYAVFSPTHTRTKGAHRSALTGQASSLSLGGTATSAAEKPLFPALSAVDVKI